MNKMILTLSFVFVAFSAHAALAETATAPRHVKGTKSYQTDRPAVAQDVTNNIPNAEDAANIEPAAGVETGADQAEDTSRKPLQEKIRLPRKNY